MIVILIICNPQLGYNYVQLFGLATNDDYPYWSGVTGSSFGKQHVLMILLLIRLSLLLWGHRFLTFKSIKTCKAKNMSDIVSAAYQTNFIYVGSQVLRSIVISN